MLQLKMPLALAISFGFVFAQAQDLDAARQAKVNAKIEMAKKWAAAPVMVNAVKKSNKSGEPAYQDMTQARWEKLAVLDPLVTNLAKNEAGKFLKKNKSEAVSEAFLNAADGTKVALLAKTTNWSHKGNPKHDQPMAGQTWTGKVEMDESTGVQQIQISVPVLDGGKPIGSLVVGLAVSKL